MSLRRKDEKPALAQRFSLWLMTGGIVLLLGSLVGAFVVVPVLLVQSSRRKEADDQEARRRAELKEERKPGVARAEPSTAKPPVPEPPKPPKPARVEPQPIAAAPPAPAAPAAKAPKDAVAVDPEGYIRTWLVLAPIRSPFQPYSSAQEIHKSQIPNEARIRPKADDHVAFPDRERIWQRVASTEYLLDFQKVVGVGRSDDAIAYAVCYIHAPQPMTGLRLLMGCNDTGKVYLNGAQLLVWDKPRPLTKDQDVANDVQLQRGENVLVFKVVNDKGNWQGCIRFTDRNNQPVKALQISLTPQ